MVWFPGHTRTSGICSIALLCLQAVLPLARAELVHAVFEVAEGDDKGSCDGLEDLNDIFEEALDMAEAAYDGINGVIGKESSRTTRKALYMMFDIDSSDYHNDGKKLPRLEKAGMLRAQRMLLIALQPEFILWIFLLLLNFRLNLNDRRDLRRHLDPQYNQGTQAQIVLRQLLPNFHQKRLRQKHWGENRSSDHRSSPRQVMNIHPVRTQGERG